MESEKIIQNLNRRFTEPFPEFYKRRIIYCLTSFSVFCHNSHLWFYFNTLFLRRKS